jgi:hypothetical protein
LKGRKFKSYRGSLANAQVSLSVASLCTIGFRPPQGQVDVNVQVFYFDHIHNHKMSDTRKHSANLRCLTFALGIFGFIAIITVLSFIFKGEKFAADFFSEESDGVNLETLRFSFAIVIVVAIVVFYQFLKSRSNNSSISEPKERPNAQPSNEVNSEAIKSKKQIEIDAKLKERYQLTDEQVAALSEW